MENGNGTGTESRNRNYQWKMPDEGYHVNIQDKLSFFVGSLDLFTLLDSLA